MVLALMSPTRKIVWLMTLVAGVALTVAIWHQRTSPRATPELCRAVVLRLVEFELHHQGYADPLLIARKQAELVRRYADELDRCIGRPVRAHALLCVQKARSSEAIGHDCL